MGNNRSGMFWEDETVPEDQAIDVVTFSMAIIIIASNPLADNYASYPVKL